jgi:hypothetical protein
LALHDPLAHAGTDEGIGEREAERL